MSYSPYKFKPAVARRVADLALPDLKTFMAEHKATHVAVTGSSGISLMALLAANGFNLIQVRKPGEESHGEYVEYFGQLPEDLRFVFLDDFVQSGATLSRTNEAVYLTHERTHIGHGKCTLAGIYTLREVVGTAYTNARKVNGQTVPHREWGF